MEGHRLGEEVIHPLEGFRVGVGPLGTEAQVPVPLGAGDAVLPHEEVPGREGLDIAEKGVGRLDEPECQVLVQRERRERAEGGVARQERLDLRGEGEAAIPLGVEQRLLTEVIAGDEQALAAAVPDREHEHAPEPLEHPLAFVLEQVHEDLGVGAGAELVPAPPELLPQLLVVVDLAVEDHLQVAVFVRDRLVPAGEVDDAEPTHAEPEATFDEGAPVVGPPMPDGVAHPPDLRLGHGARGRRCQRCHT